jgi:hypothetical protein
MTKQLSSLALVALLLSACSGQSNSAADNSAANSAADNSAATTASDSSAPAAAASPMDSSDPLAQYTPIVQKMEAGIDNNYADLVTDKKNGAETVTSIGFFPQYPCTVASNDKVTYWGYCIMGVNAAQSDADAGYQAALKIAGGADPSLKPGTPPADKTNIASTLLQNDTHAVYIFETKQANGGKYLVKMTFGKPASFK